MEGGLDGHFQNFKKCYEQCKNVSTIQVSGNMIFHSKQPQKLQIWRTTASD